LHQQVALVPRTSEPAHDSLLSVIATLPARWRELRARRAVVEQVLAHYRRHVPAELRTLAAPIAECRRLYAAEVRAAAAGALLRSWRALHRFSALLMVSLVAMHIAIAWYYGFVLAVSG
jgi:hypothetical protein